MTVEMFLDNPRRQNEKRDIGESLRYTKEQDEENLQYSNDEYEPTDASEYKNDNTSTEISCEEGSKDKGSEGLEQTDSLSTESDDGQDATPPPESTFCDLFLFFSFL